MKLTLLVWRQAGPGAPGKMVPYPVDNVSPDMSFLEVLDVINEGLVARGEEPIAFDSDCREGIWHVRGGERRRHGPGTPPRLPTRHFRDGETITVEPWRQRSPHRTDGGPERARWISPPAATMSVNVGAQNQTRRRRASGGRTAMDSAACIGAAGLRGGVQSASAVLFVGKIPACCRRAASRRAARRGAQMDAEGFGNCSTRGGARPCPKDRC